MAVDYRLLHRFEASRYMETALREAAAGIAARRRVTPEEELDEPANVVALRPATHLCLAEDDR
jgi:hypothetical protein